MSVSGVGSTPYVPVPNQVKQQQPLNQQPATPAVPPAASNDSDGDHDGSKGGKINTYAQGVVLSKTLKPGYTGFFMLVRSIFDSL